MIRLLVIGLSGLLLFMPTTALGGGDNIPTSTKNSEKTKKQRLIHNIFELLPILR